MIGITNCFVRAHSKELADATITDLGHDRLVIGALALAYTGYDVLNKQVDLS